MQKAIKKYFPIFVLPTMLAFLIGFVVPFILGLVLSFCRFNTVSDAQFVGLERRYICSFPLVYRGVCIGDGGADQRAGICCRAAADERIPRDKYIQNSIFYAEFDWGHYPRVYLAADFQWYSCVGGADTDVQRNIRLLGAGDTDDVAAGGVHDDHLHCGAAEYSRGSL